MIKQLWMIMHSLFDPDLPRRANVTPLKAQILQNRGCRTEEEIDKYLHANLDDLYDPLLMSGMAEAVSLMQESLHAGKKIRVIGDYDVDGMTSTFILLDGLKKLGAGVSYDIPDRIMDGYGLSQRLVEQAHADGIETIITCDNGIAAVNEIAKAKEYGMTVIVTDHHSIPETLPNADVIIDPHQPGDNYPYKTICGAVVAWKFILALYAAEGKELSKHNIYMVLAGLATNCDVMPIEDENRIILKYSLAEIQRTDNIGLHALLEATGLLEKEKLYSYDYGFVIGPCMNTQGRLHSAKYVVDLLNERDMGKAKAVAAELKAENDERKAMTQKYQNDFIQELSARQNLGNVIVELAPGLHESLAGIVAGKIKEAFYRPTIILTESEGDNTIYKGSGRSIEGYNIFEELKKVNEDQIMPKCGGHPLACGLSIKKDQVDELRKRLNDNEQMTEEILTSKLKIDAGFAMGDFNTFLIDELEELEPFGNKCPRPTFGQKNLTVTKIYTNEKKTMLRLTVRDKKGRGSTLTTFDAEGTLERLKQWCGEETCDRLLKNSVPNSGLEIDVVYTADINEFRGERNPQFKIVDMRLSQ
ncbi:MAG: single-stranded-DNA-specific exonuclease RecJ [Lachnospiraceae bacterium]|nr:single-stranded-DNA-specific exonuclease RecJ [Lachnospiraceae bacterium]